jgi:hypothetical protein
LFVVLSYNPTRVIGESVNENPWDKEFVSNAESDLNAALETQIPPFPRIGKDPATISDPMVRDSVSLN